MDNLTAEFEKLILNYLKGNSTPQEAQKLSTLLKENPSFKQIYQYMTSAYALASVSWFEQRKQQNLEQLRDTLNFRSSSKRSLSRKISIWSSAAIVTLLLGLGSYLAYNTPQSMPIETSYCKIEIPRGNTSKLLLPDGTVVYINGSTTLKYDASLQHQSKREVFLTGEAYFEVAENAEKPFLVYAEDLKIKVLGTAFNVAAYPDNPNIKVSLNKGSVKVSLTSEAQPEIVLAPNEQAVYNKTNKRLSTAKVEAATQSAWTTGRLVFVNEKLLDILKRIEEKYDTQFLIQSQKVSNEYFSGSIDSSLSLDEILSYIDVDNKFKWKREGKTTVIMDK